MLIGAGIGIPFQQNVLARLLGSAEFFAPLTHSAIPTRAAFGTTATFTRATTSTWKNNDGYLVTGVAGEIGFVGARRVRNLVTKSEDLTSGWSANNAGSVTATTITFTAANNDGWVITAFTPIVGNTYRWSALVSTVSGTKNIRFRAGGAALSADIPITTTPTRVSALFTSVTAGGNYGIYNESAGGAATINCTQMQLEDVTGQTTQTAGEYVSVGVESAPYYHGSMVDGVKCFNTDIAGNAIPSTTMLGYSAEGARTNLCLQSNAFTTTWGPNGTTTSAQNAVGPSGSANEAWTLGDTDAATSSDIRQSVVIANDSAQRVFQIRVGKTSGAVTFPGIGLLLLNGTSVLGQFAINTNSGVATARSTNTGTVSATITSEGDFWLVSVSATNNSTGNTDARMQIFPAINANASDTWVTSTVGTAIFAYAQLELGSFASSYIATTTIAVTRNKDEESVSTSGNIAAAAGSIYLEYTPTHAPSGTVAFWGTYVDADNYTAILHDATNLIFRKRIAGVNYDATIANAFVSGTTYKACATWGASGTSITLNGTEGTPHANTTAAQIGSTMQWGADGNSLQQPFAYLRNCRDWLRQLSASERVAVTA